MDPFDGNQLTDENIRYYRETLNGFSPVDIADLIECKGLSEQICIFNALSPSVAVATFEYLNPRIQKQILYAIPSNQAADILNALSPDDRTAFLSELPANWVNQLLKYLSPHERALTVKLLGYPEKSVGRLMTPDYISVKLDWTVQEVLNYIRTYGKDSETLNVVYGVDEKGMLIDEFHIGEFLLAPPETQVSRLVNFKFIALHVDEDEQLAINLFRKYNRVALPVIDSEGILLGIITFDDIMQIVTEEDTEDIQRIGGVAALKEPYMDMPFFILMRKRAGWLCLLFLGEMLTASALSYYEDEISKAVVLALFMPLIVSSGGNAGSQACTLIIRAIALGEITLKDWWRVMRREILSGLFLGTILGCIGFFRITIWSAFSTIYGIHWTAIALTVSFSLVGVVLWGTLSGSMLPLILNRCGLDPAVSSAPFVATLVDVTGLIIYFSIAMIILRGTLL